MKVQFHQTMYNLVQVPYIYSTRFQCNILKGNNTYDSIIEDTESPETITVYDDNDEVKGVYSGYTHRLAVVIMDDISLEFENTDITQQIQELANQLINQQGEIDDINSQIEEITPYTETKTAYIGDESVTFNDVPEGNLSVFTKDSEGNEIEYSVAREDNKVIVTFNPLEYVTDVTISIQ